MSKEQPERITLTIFNTRVEIPVFQSVEKTLEIAQNLEEYMKNIYKEYQVLQTQMIAVRAAYDFLISIELLKKQLSSLTENTLNILKELTIRINNIREEIDNLNSKES